MFDSIIQVSKEDPVLARHLPYQSDIEPARGGVTKNRPWNQTDIYFSDILNEYIIAYA